MLVLTHSLGANGRIKEHTSRRISIIFVSFGMEALFTDFHLPLSPTSRLLFVYIFRHRHGRQLIIISLFLRVLVFLSCSSVVDGKVFPIPPPPPTRGLGNWIGCKWTEWHERQECCSWEINQLVVVTVFLRSNVPEEEARSLVVVLV